MPSTNIRSRWNEGYLEFYDSQNPGHIYLKITADRVNEVLSANQTLDNQDCGKLIMVDTDGVVLTLPSTAAGLTFEVMNIGVNGAVQVSIDPAALDQIIGNDLTAADDKDLINTKATAKSGDKVELVGNGTTGWIITEIVGTWAREA